MADVLTALGMVTEPSSLLCLIFGVGVGIMFGAMPGLSVNMGLALLLPLAFAFKGMSGILMLLGIYCGAIYGGSISAGNPCQRGDYIGWVSHGYAAPSARPGVGAFDDSQCVWRDFQYSLSDYLRAFAGQSISAIFQTGIFCAGGIRLVDYYQRICRECDQGHHGRYPGPVSGNGRH